MSDYVSISMTSGPQRVVTDDPDPSFQRRPVGFTNNGWFRATPEALEALAEETALLEASEKAWAAREWAERQRGRKPL